MVIKAGDRVKFLSDTRQGTVVSVAHGLAMVNVEGFEIPTRIADLVVVAEDEEKKAFRIMGGEEKEEVRGFRGDKSQKKKTSVPTYKTPVYGKISLENDWEDEPIDLPKQKEPQNQSIEDFYSQMSKDSKQEEEEGPKEVPYTVTQCHVKLVFVPTEKDKSPENSDLDMYLVNDSSYRLYYSIARWQKRDYVETIATGELDDDTKLLVTSFKRKEMNEIIQLQISIIPFKKMKFIPVEGASGKLELHPLKFVRVKNYVDSDYFDEKVIEYSLISND